MSQPCKLRQSRHQGKRKAKERAEHHRYLRKALERISKERDRSQQALKETQDRLRQQEVQAQGLVVHHKGDLVGLALPLFVGARISFRAVSRVLRLLAEVFGIQKAPCPQTLVNWVTSLAMVRIPSARRLQGVSVSLVPCTTDLFSLFATMRRVPRQHTARFLTLIGRGHRGDPSQP